MEMQNLDHNDDYDLLFVTNYFLDDDRDLAYNYFNIYPSDLYNKTWNPQVLIKVYIGQIISVVGSIKFIKLMFSLTKEILYSNLREWFKFRTQPIWQEHLRYELLFQSINTATDAFYFHRSIAFCAPSDYCRHLLFEIQIIFFFLLKIEYKTFSNKYFCFFFVSSK